MKTIATVKKLTGALLAGVVLMLFANAASAATAANTTVSNSATLNYSVNSVAQSQITSTAATFKVDQAIKIDVAKSDGAKVGVNPNQNGPVVLTFLVTNNGNATEDVDLSSLAKASGTADPFGGAQNDNFDGGTMNTFVENGVTGGYQAAQDTATDIASLAAGTSKTVYIVLTGTPAIPATQVNGDVAVYALVGQASTAASCATACVHETQDTTTDKNANNTNLNTVYKLFIDTVAGTDDSATDGIGSDRDAFVVSAASLTITKSSRVISDPVSGTDNGTTIHARAIPGAVMEYTITVANAAGVSVQTATGITIADIVPATLTYVANSIVVTEPNANSGNPIACSDSGTTTGEVTCSFTSGTTTVNTSGVHLDQSQTLTVVFQATIN